MLNVSDRPRFTAETARQMALDVFGVTVSAEQLHSERDQNFLLSLGGRPSWVLKIANLYEERQTLEMQNEALQVLESYDGSLPVPRVLPSLEGEHIASVPGKMGSYLVRLFSYLPGSPLANFSPHSKSLLVALGRFLGEVDRALRGFEHEAADRQLQWNVFLADKVVSENLQWILDTRERALVERFLNTFQERTLPGLTALRQGIIHNDANDHNILVHRQRGGTGQIAGLLDFGDMMWAPVVYEAAVAAAYVMQSAAAPLSAAAQLVQGYHSQYPLRLEEAEALHDLISIRLCTTVTLAAKRTKLEPEQSYLSISEAGAWRVLRYLNELNRTDVAERFLQACGASFRSFGLNKDQTTLLGRRRQSIGPSLSLSYEDPLHIVRGYRQFLYSDTGRAYLDCVNNVAHVGHCHPAVVEAGCRQMAILNTNTRFLHDFLLQYAERLTATFPDPLNVCFFVCSGSEANELALRMARTVTGRRHMIVLDGAYHGNTAGLIDHSPYKHNGPGGSGTPGHVHIAPMPDPYRGKYRGQDAGERYAGDVKDIVERLCAVGDDPAGIICEPLLGCGGQLVLPVGFLAQAFSHVRASGGVCIADEVQVGFGRVGTHFWAFESQDAMPDIVTLGKPIGNGHPVAAVVTTAEIANAFANGMEYFNTFGGNPVSCAIGMAVLDVIEEEALQSRALQVGDMLLDGLSQLMNRHQLIGDVRGLGLFIGVELVQDRQTKRPAAEEAKRVVELMKQRGILLSIDGPDHNVIKIKPPLVISERDACFVVEQLDKVLSQ